MGKRLYVNIHINPVSSCQTMAAKAFLAGLERHNVKGNITENRYARADVHVIVGPNYAEFYWNKHPNTIKLDRAYYLCPSTAVSCGWLRPDGSRDFYREQPNSINFRESKTGSKTIFLAEYRQDIREADLVGVDTIRRHPLDTIYPLTLEQSLEQHQKAIGYNTSALVTAGILGLGIICKSKSSIMSRPDWKQQILLTDWCMSELESGACWSNLALNRF